MNVLSLFVELAVASGEFAQAVSDLSAADVGKQLSHSLAGLTDVQRKVQDLQSFQSEQDMTTLMATGMCCLLLFDLFFFFVLLVLIREEIVDEYARLINSVRVSDSVVIRYT